MGRLIDADALGVGEANRDVFIVPEYADGWNSAIKMIKNAPTVDAVPVVRCRECVHWGEEEFAEGGYRVCCCEEKEYATNEPSKKYAYFPVTAANDFCSYGERRGE